MNSFLLGSHPSAAPIKVLVVDSDSKNVHELAAAFRSQGYEPLEATSFEAGKQLWTAEKPALLIVDIRLGQFNGLQLLIRAKIDRPDVAAVITCAFRDTVLEAETRRMGATFLVKPLKAEEVMATLVGSNPPSPWGGFPERRVGDWRQSLTTSGLFPERRLVDRRRLKTD